MIYKFTRSVYSLFAALAFVIAVQTSAPAEAFTGFEAQLQFSETIDGQINPAMKIQVANFVNNFGLGGYLGTNETLGLNGIWRIFEAWPNTTWGTAFLLGTSSALWQGQTDTARQNVTYYAEIRGMWAGLQGKAEVGLAVQQTTIKGMDPEWTFAITLNFHPGSDSRTPGIPGAISRHHTDVPIYTTIGLIPFGFESGVISADDFSAEAISATEVDGFRSDKR